MSTFNLSLNHHLDLPDDVFRLMRDQIYKRTGMWFSDTSKYLLQKRLSPRARELNFDSFQKYFYFLQYDPRAEAEFDQIYDLVTTNETYFFREPAQLAAFAEEIVPEILARKSVKKIRIWSAGCSSGEEPYSIAMLLAEAGYYDHAAFEIFASDINQQVLAKARRGHYRESAFRATERPLRDKYFTRNDDGSWHIHDDIRNRVSFGRLNLYDEAARLAPRPPRRDLLPQRHHLFRRPVEEGGGLEFLQPPHRRRLPAPRPLGVADLSLHAIQTAPSEERHGVPEVTR